MHITVSLQAEAVFALLKALPREMVPVAAMRALNKTAISAKSTAVKAMAKNMGMTQSKIRPCVQLRKATRFCCDAVLCVAKAKRLPLIAMDARAKQTRTGVSYRGAEGYRRSIPHAFIATMPTGHRGIYARKSGAGRLPVIELSGVSMDYVFKQPIIQRKIIDTVNMRWQTVFEHEITFALYKRNLK